MTEFMRSSDAFTWAMESDPRLRSTVVTVLLLEKSPNWDDVRDRIDLISRKLPMFRQRVVESPPPAPPRWESDPDFDLDFHIREMAAPEPGNLGGVLEIARVAEMEDFDRARLLWTVTLIDGLEDAGAAMLCKFHHSLTDGVGGVQIGMTLFDLSELSWRARPVVGSAEGAPAAVVERIPRCVRLRRGTRRNGDGGRHHVGSETDLQQPPTPAGDRRIRNGHCGFDLPNRSTRESHRVPSDEEPDYDPSPWRASGADATATGGGPP